VTQSGRISTPLRVLLLEDMPTDAELTLRELRKGGIEVLGERVDTREAFERALAEFRPDLILSDFSLPQSFDGLAALEIARCVAPDIPYIFVSGTIGEDRAVEAMKRGATDYVLKDRLNRVASVVRRALDERREREARRHAERELEETRNRLDSIVASLSDAVWSVAVEPTRGLFLSRAFEAIWGRPMVDFYANADVWLESVHPDDRERVAQLWREAVRGAPFDVTYRIVRRDGETRWIQDRGTTIRDAEGKVVRIDGIARDVTGQKHQELRILRLSRMHAMLSAITTVVARVTDRNALFRDACRIAVHHGGFALAWIGSLDPVTQEARPVAWEGGPADFAEGLRPSLRADVPAGQGTGGMAMRERKAVFVNDMATDARVAEPAAHAERGFLAMAALPLVVGGTSCGVMKLYSRDAGVFDREETKLLEEMAGHISFSLDHIAKSERLDYLAYYDGLTGLPNRSLFSEQVAQLSHSIAAEEQGLAVVMLDPERFRNVNETLGMATGDVLLKALAQRLDGAVGEAGSVARISSDRFALALAPVKGATEIAHALENRIFPALSEPFDVDGRELHVPVKAGVAVFPADGADAVSLLLHAESALSRAKQSGERYVFYAPHMNTRVAERLRIENELRRAVLEEQFVLYYQPRVELATGAIIGLEALLRWAHPAHGLVSPDEFIPVLEDTGLILEVGRWALARAARDHVRWRAEGLKVPRIAVNVAAIQMRHNNFVEDVKSALAPAAGNWDRFDLEITETMLMDDVEGNIQKLGTLRAMGIDIAIDDFGIGYSSLSYLARLPVGAFKIDRSFVARMTGGPDQLAIVSTIISLGRALNLKVVAEGVETDEQANLLRLLRCDEAQGYLLGRPLPAAEIRALLAGAP
jgi:diguanylate cyclase (GGDEF)-like protein/PAS domain S-box-containing protein